MQSKPKLKENLIVLGILFLLLTVSFYDVVFLGKTFKVSTANAQAMHYGVYGQKDNKPAFIPVNGTDSPVLEEPVYRFVKDNLKKGILPLWNPHQACGYPFIAMIQIGLFFPLNFILYILPDLFAWDVMIFIRFILAGIFTYWFMRHLGYRRVASLGSGIAFMLSGPMVLLQYWTANVNILIPLLLIGLNLIVKSTNLKSLVYLSVVIAFTVFAGHPEHIFLVNLYGILFLCFRLFSLRKSIDIKKSIIFVGLAYILGICLSAVILFPFLRNMMGEFWHGHPEGVGLYNEETRERALTLALPFFFQKETLTYMFAFSGWWGGYIGTLPIILSILSLFKKHKSGLNYFLAILAFFILGKAYGLFFINWVGYLPIFNVVRYAIHTPHLVAFTFAVLTGMGISTALDDKKILLKGLFCITPLIIISAINLYYVRFASHFKISIEASLFALGVLAVFMGILFLKDKKILKTKIIGILLIVALSAELFLYIHRERPHRFETFGKVPYIEFLKDKKTRNRHYGIFWTFYPNTATGFGLDDLGVFFGLLPKRFVEFVDNLINPNIFKNDLRPPALRSLPLTYGTPFLDMLNVQYLITPQEEMMRKILTQYKPNEKSKKTPVYADEVFIYRRKNAFKRTYIVHRALFQPDKKKAFKFLKGKQLYLKEFVVLNAKADVMILAAIRNAPLHDNSTTKITKYSPNEVIVEADVKNAGFLVLSDAYHPDWKVFVNEKPSRLYLANNLIRSVFLPSGQHTVRFVFRPKSFYWGLSISLLTLLAMILLFNCDRLKLFRGFGRKEL